jgi:hypothetical protein
LRAERVELPAGAELGIPPDAFVFLIDGSATIDGRRLAAGEGATGGLVKSDERARLLVVAGT